MLLSLWHTFLKLNLSADEKATSLMLRWSWSTRIYFFFEVDMYVHGIICIRIITLFHEKWGIET